MATTIKLDGFRKGKVPASVVKTKFGPQIEHEALTELTQATLSEALQEKKLMPVASPKVELGDYKAGQAVKVTATFEVYPEIKLANLSKLKVEKVTADIGDSDINDAIEKLQKQAVTWDDVDRAAKMGDRVTMDFEGFIKDEPLEGGKAEGFDLELGSGQFIPGFEEGLVGAKKDEKKTISVKFPKDYHAKDIAGKKARFEVAVKQVSEAKLPELTDELAANYGIKEGGVEGLKDEIRKNLTRDRDFLG